MSINALSARDWEDLKGTIVTRTFSPGYVVLSYVVSYVGAWTTLELINRRTTFRGLYNWSLLVGASISMGGIAIWCMHFIGNRAIVLAGGDPQVQIAYSSGFTALSFFIPIIVLFLGFSTVGSNEKVSLVRIAMGGTLAGLGICGMHYLGQAGISNYDCIYVIANVVGAAVIAVVASITALGIFFMFRSAWVSSWWKRALCAVILAGAVSGMHWLASVGTQYRLKSVGSSMSNSISRNSTVIVVIVLSIAGCFILLLLTLFAQAQRARSANRAQQVVLASAVFDKDGRLMVTAEGLLPNRKITNSYLERSFDDVFGISHPVFLWIFRATRNWESVTNLLPGMRSHVVRAGLKSNILGYSADDKLVNDLGTPVEDYSILFRELFCMAAAELADDLNESIENVGILFDEIISTGQNPKQKGKGVKNGTASEASSVDLERDGLALEKLGRGQLLFLVKEVDRREAEHLQAAGFRFAMTPNVIPILAGTMQIPRRQLSRHLEVMREYATESHILEPGVHFALFAIRASIGAGFDILARRDARNQLPTMQLPIETLEAWQLEYLKTLDGCSVTLCLKTLNKASKSASAPPKDKLFASQLQTTIEALKEEINDPFFNDAILVAQPVEAPCRGNTEDSPPGTAMLICFRLIVPIHSRAPGKKLDFTPLNFFKMQQHIYKNSPDHAVFARKTYREFAPLLELSGRPSIAELATPKSAHFPGKSGLLGTMKNRAADTMSGDTDVFGRPISSLLPRTPASGRSSIRRKLLGRRGTRPGEKMRGDNSSEKNLVDVNSSEDRAFGGIMVSQEVSVDVKDVGDGRRDSSSPSPTRDNKTAGIEMTPLSPVNKNGVVSKVTKEEETASFVDEMFRICIQARH